MNVRTIRNASAMVLGLLVAVSYAPQGALAAGGADDLTELSLEDLMATEVTSVARKRQRVADTAAAVFVITQDDIRRSGARSIPEALRMAPGMEVARIDAQNTAVSARGFNSRVSAKLLVLVDGRWVYTPSAGTVLWEQIAVPLELVERIEVVRGPGGAVWGANAVNAVVNIITKHPADTQGGAVALQFGTEGTARAYAQHSGVTGEATAFRVFGQAEHVDSLLDQNGDAINDGLKRMQAGFRLDTEMSERDTVTVQGEALRGDFETTLSAPLPTPPYAFYVTQASNFDGAHLLARWTHVFSDSFEATAQGYLDRVSSGDLATREMIDTEITATWRPADWSALTFGGGARLTRDSYPMSDYYIVRNPNKTNRWIGAFAQHEASLLDDRFKLTLGARIEHNEQTGMEIQPSARALFNIAEGHSIWGAVSRASRTPAMVETDFTFAATMVPPNVLGNPLPLRLDIVGNDMLRSEQLDAYEIGYRGVITPRFNLDVAAFRHEYKNLIGANYDPANTTMAFDPRTGAPFLIGRVDIMNTARASATGVEIAAEAALAPWWRLKLSATHQKLDYQFDGNGVDIYGGPVGTSPATTISLRSQFELSDNMDLDLWLRHVGKLTTPGIDAYTTLDARLAWRFDERAELSVVARDLFGADRREFTDRIYPSAPGYVGPSVGFNLNVRF